MPAVLYCQPSVFIRPDKEEEPSLYKNIYYKDHYNYTDIKSITIVYNVYTSNVKQDTLSKEFYRNGNYIKYIRFRNNEPTDIIEYNYNKKNKLISTIVLRNNTRSSLSYNYDVNGRLIGIKQIESQLNKPFNILSSDSSSFEYKNNALQHESRKWSSGRVFSQKYIYVKNNLTEIIGTYTSKRFIHDDNNNLIQLNEYMGNTTVDSMIRIAGLFVTQH